MTFTGKKNYALLVQYSKLTNLPTGVVKPNTPGDPDYVAPVLDMLNCPVVGAELTTFQINNKAVDPVISDLLYHVYTGSSTGTLEPGGSISFAESGKNHAIQILAPSAGLQWGRYWEKIVIDTFVFQNDVLIKAVAIDGNLTDRVPPGGSGNDEEEEIWDHGFHIEGLSGNIVINAASNSSGQYNEGKVIAFHAAPDFGTASFTINTKIFWIDETKIINTPGQFETIDYYTGNAIFSITGENRNNYNLKLDFISNYKVWVPDDENNPDGPGVWQMENITDIIPAGSSYTKAITPANDYFGGDYIIRITKQ